ncbi:hypothetical protein M3G47_04215 [Corynebacterium sanguinis]|uniref:hypothetical protein n=1 Tax=Corynebacterium sanguinis TaxID=2594913 RepID=UPI00223BA86F|nr:hypothetical protein [Corynebacterium sanguinis]MCT1492117.1 hypothetical protein [Corynebacterium sanguinis]MCT1596990.1 hypothetical protein [Corynebacterium sanguinis]MCT2247295.1 hypothetical protein [Corynebacterium sanguinis]MCT2252378.1 hypothetical protein [Corynebacterium sanguinis]
MNSTGNSSGRNYAAAVALIVFAVLSFVFLPGPTAVFIGVAAAVAGAVFLVMGIQAANDRHPDTLEQGLYGLPETHYADGDRQFGHASPPETVGDAASDIDWDGDFRREFGGGDAGGAPEGRR